MSLIKSDKNVLYEVTCKNHRDTDRQQYLREEKKDSYYLEPNIEPEQYLQKYKFQTSAELKSVLEQWFKEQGLPMEYLQPIMVMMLKLKEEPEINDVLMESIYNF